MAVVETETPTFLDDHEGSQWQRMRSPVRGEGGAVNKFQQIPFK